MARNSFQRTILMRDSFAGGEGKPASAPVVLAPGWVLQRAAAQLENWVVFAMPSGSAEGDGGIDSQNLQYGGE